MKELDDGLWTQLFQDKPISQVSLDHFQTQLMAEITANPLDFGEEMRLVKRRKWGVGLSIALLVPGISLLALIWVKGSLIYQGLNSCLIMLGGLPYLLEFQQMWHLVIQNLLLLLGHKVELGHLWGTISGPILGILSVFVVLRSYRPFEERLFRS